VISFRADLKIMPATQPVDFRKSVHTLSALVSEALRADPYCGDVFIFRSKRSDRVKLLAWDGSGMVLVTKWLEGGRFTWPPIRDGVVTLTGTQLSMLIDGLDWTRVSPSQARRRLDDPSRERGGAGGSELAAGERLGDLGRVALELGDEVGGGGAASM
jgi:transposase